MGLSGGLRSEPKGHWCTPSSSPESSSAGLRQTSGQPGQPCPGAARLLFASCLFAHDRASKKCRQKSVHAVPNPHLSHAAKFSSASCKAGAGSELGRGGWNAPSISPAQAGGLSRDCPKKVGLSKPSHYLPLQERADQEGTARKFLLPTFLPRSTSETLLSRGLP